MKTKVLTGFLTFLLLLGLPLQSLFAAGSVYDIAKAAGYQVYPENSPQGAIVVDLATQQVLYEENADVQADLASITKLMTVLLVYEAIGRGEISLNTTVTATDLDQQISQLPELSSSIITSGESYSVLELLEMTLLNSSNIASLMLADLLSHQQLGAFVDLMNQRASQLGMTNTVFRNPSGAVTADYQGLISIPGYDVNQPGLSTARDIAKMASYLLINYPDILTITSQQEIWVGTQTSTPEKLVNTNLSIEGAKDGSQGVDGLKTGSGELSGYSYVATAKRQDIRLVEVILGVGPFKDAYASVEKHYFGNALLDEIYRELDTGELTIKQPEPQAVAQANPQEADSGAGAVEEILTVAAFAILLFIFSHLTWYYVFKRKKSAGKGRH